MIPGKCFSVYNTLSISILNSYYIGCHVAIQVYKVRMLQNCRLLFILKEHSLSLKLHTGLFKIMPQLSLYPDNWSQLSAQISQYSLFTVIPSEVKEHFSPCFTPRRLCRLATCAFSCLGIWYKNFHAVGMKIQSITENKTLLSEWQYKL